MFILYDIFYAILLVFYTPILFIKGKLHQGYYMRFGRFEKNVTDQLSAKDNIWVHAVSVGEVVAILDLVDKLKDMFADKQIVCSVVTKTGYALAKEKLKDKAIIVYAPLDFSIVVRKFIRHISPSIYILAETEIWPNIFYFLSKKSVPIIQVNGRISDRSYAGYRWLGILTKSVLSKVDSFCMQSEADARRIEKLGGQPARIKVIGNLKFDNLPKESNITKEDIGLYHDDELLIAGSTHPGEEQIMISSYLNLKVRYPMSRLIICPRHVERAEEILRYIESIEAKGVCFSQIKGTKIDRDVIIIVDTIGQLRDLYSLAKVVFVGKTFKVGGGQNMLEPAYFGKPVILGPLTENFRDIVELLLNEKAIVQVGTPEEFNEELLDIWSNPVRYESLGMAARRVVNRFQGATLKTVKEVERLMLGADQ